MTQATAGRGGGGGGGGGGGRGYPHISFIDSIRLCTALQQHNACHGAPPMAWDRTAASGVPVCRLALGMMGGQGRRQVLHHQSAVQAWRHADAAPKRRPPHLSSQAPTQ